MSRTMKRDHKLFVLLEEDQQLPLELELLDIAVRVATRSLWATVESREERGLFIVWTISTYQDARLVRRRLERFLPDDVRWYLRSGNRVEHGPLSRRDIGLLLDFTGLSDTRRAS